HIYILPTSPHPISTLFPYTTLFRSVWNQTRREPGAAAGTDTWRNAACPCARAAGAGADSGRTRRARPQPTGPILQDSRLAPGRRSEEHTSELQSQSNLVCRLLLEKK